MTQVIYLTNGNDTYEWWDENVGEEAGAIGSVIVIRPRLSQPSPGVPE